MIFWTMRVLESFGSTVHSLLQATEEQRDFKQPFLPAHTKFNRRETVCVNYLEPFVFLPQRTISYYATLH